MELSLFITRFLSKSDTDSDSDSELGSESSNDSDEANNLLFMTASKEKERYFRIKRYVQNIVHNYSEIGTSCPTSESQAVLCR